MAEELPDLTSSSTSFVIGTNATITSSTPEGQLLVALIMLQNYEANSANNPNSRDYVQGSFNINTKRFASTIVMPCTQSISSTGEAKYTAQDYLTGVTFSPGSPAGTLKSTNLPAYLIEILTYCRLLEKNASVNKSSKENITYNYDGNTGILTAQVTLDCNMSQNNSGGSASFTVVPYLTLS